MTQEMNVSGHWHNRGKVKPNYLNNPKKLELVE